MDFTSVAGLSTAIKAGLLTSANGVVKRIAIETVQNSIEANVYNAYVPDAEVYTRSYSLYNAVKMSPVTIGNTTLKFEIYIDSSLLTPVDGGGAFNSYKSLTGETVSDSVASWVEEGHSVMGKAYSGRGYMQKAFEDLNDGTLVRAFANGLRAYGFSVTVS